MPTNIKRWKTWLNFVGGKNEHSDLLSISRNTFSNSVQPVGWEVIVSDSIDLLKAKRELAREIKEETRKQLLEELVIARQRAMALNDKGLLHILAWYDILSPFRVSLTSIINYLAGKCGSPAVNDESIDDDE